MTNVAWFNLITGELIKPGDTKCVLTEGMPMYRRPFEKGRLIIHFSVRIFSIAIFFVIGIQLLLIGYILQMLSFQ